MSWIVASGDFFCFVGGQGQGQGPPWNVVREEKHCSTDVYLFVEGNPVRSIVHWRYYHSEITVAIEDTWYYLYTPEISYRSS